MRSHVVPESTRSEGFGGPLVPNFAWARQISAPQNEPRRKNTLRRAASKQRRHEPMDRPIALLPTAVPFKFQARPKKLPAAWDIPGPLSPAPHAPRIDRRARPIHHHLWGGVGRKPQADARPPSEDGPSRASRRHGPAIGVSSVSSEHQRSDPISLLLLLSSLHPDQIWTQLGYVFVCVRRYMCVLCGCVCACFLSAPAHLPPEVDPPHSYTIFLPIEPSTTGKTYLPLPSPINRLISFRPRAPPLIHADSPHGPTDTVE